ncbi:MAG TPA: MarR family transcriptional regulator [Terriglobales bacterium]|jgi:DNA-binding MarR family transcriptional regulator|nr:MarR family transcriptional regulator [Terriglobales bacterium]
MEKNLTPQDYRSLAEFRHQIRRYLRFSEKIVRNAELEPRQYQLLLALKGLSPEVRPRIAELAERLQIQHHSAVELTDRLEEGGLVRRQRGSKDRREVLVSVTPAGERVIRDLVMYHRTELFSLGPALLESLHRVLRKTERTSDSRRRRKK